MKFFDALAKRFGYVRPRQRSYEAAIMSRLNSDWLAAQTSADAEINGSFKTLIGRSRQLARNNEYMKRYMNMLDNNVLGACGIGLQMKVKDLSGDYDRQANSKIEEAFDLWGYPETCSVTGKQSWREVQAIVLRAMPTDGNILVRKVITAGNPFRFALQLIEIDQLDIDFNKVEHNGNQVRFGIERDQFGKPMAYHLFSRHPGDLTPSQAAASRYRMRVPASEIIHVCRPLRVGQTLSEPWATPAMSKISMLGKFEEAALVRAREGAAVGYAIETNQLTDYTGPTDAMGQPLQPVEPGMGMRLSPGEVFKSIDPAYPHEMYAEFIKSCLRSIASGLDIAYSSLANDYSGANFTSIRAERLNELESYKSSQSWFICSFIQPVFEAWLEMALLSGAIKLPVLKLDKFNAAEWKPRRWDWVDPLNDTQSAVLRIQKGMTSLRRVISESGQDIEDIFQEQAEDKKLAEKYGLDFEEVVDQSANKVEEKPRAPDDPNKSITVNLSQQRNPPKEYEVVRDNNGAIVRLKQTPREYEVVRDDSGHMVKIRLNNHEGEAA